MSGICGWIGGGRHGDGAATLGRMASALPERGGRPAVAQTEVDYGLAHRAPGRTGSLATDGSIIAAIEGHFSWRDAQTQAVARDRGHATALISAFRTDGASLFRRLGGAFSLTVIDTANRHALIAIDRFGVHSMCYALASDGALVFGSTADAVRAHPRVATTLRIQALYEYLTCVDRVPAPGTIYDEIGKLAPAEYVAFDGGRIVVRRYWDMPYRSRMGATKPALVAELMSKIKASVAAAVSEEAPHGVGTFLSGGLDSSTVTGLAAKLIPGVKSFTIGFPIENYDETRYAELVARAFATTHCTYKITPKDVGDILLRSVGMYDEPFANSSAVPAYYCAKAAQDAGVEVMLAGDGGDELFGGNERYVKDRVFDHYLRIPATLRRALLEPLARAVPVGISFAPLRKFARYVSRASLPVPDRILQGLFTSLTPETVFSPDALPLIDADATRALMRSIYDAPAEATKVQRMMWFDLRVILADGDLRKVGRMCELAGVRVRYPFLDEELAEFSAALPESLLLEGGELRSFYKQAMKGFLPDAVLVKEKHGFGLPYFDFVTSDPDLRDLFSDALDNLARRGLFRPEYLNAMAARLRARSSLPGDGVVWDFAVLELWLQSRRL